jgi:trigger factor
MLVQKKELANSRVKLTISVTAKEFQEAFQKELGVLSKGVKIPGFRPGKAPENKMIEHLGRTRIEAEALDSALSKTYAQVLKETGIRPTEVAAIEITEYTAPDSNTDPGKVVATYTAEVDIIPEVKIDGYQKIKVKKLEPPVIEEDEVKKVIDYLIKQKAVLEEVPEDVVVEKGMWLEIGYEGSVDGVKRPDMINKNHPLILGEGELIPGFEEALIGLKKGSVHTFKITFPKDYHAKELAGKKAEFTVTVKDVKKVNLPPLDLEFAKSFGHESVEALQKAIRENLHEEKEEKSHQELEEMALEELLKVAKFDLPKSLIDQELDRIWNDSRDRLEKMNFQWETYLQQTGKSMETLKDEMRTQAEKNVRIGLALGKLADLENITDREEAGHLAISRLIEIATK